MRPPVLRKLPDLGMATRVRMSPLAGATSTTAVRSEDDFFPGCPSRLTCPFPHTMLPLRDGGPTRWPPEPGIVVGTGGARFDLWDFRLRSSVEVSTSAASLMTLLCELRELLDTRFLRPEREGVPPTPVLLRKELLRPQALGTIWERDR